GYIYHGKGNNNRKFQVYNLGCKKQISLQVAGISNKNNQVMMIFLVNTHQNIINCPFIFPSGIYTISSGQINNFSYNVLGNSGFSGFLIYSYTGEISHFLIHSGKGIEK